MKTRTGKAALLLLAAALLLTAGGCRARTSSAAHTGGEAGSGRAAGQETAAEPRGAESLGSGAEDDDTGKETRENPESDRKEFDAGADAEIIPGAARTAAGDGDGEAASHAAEKADRQETMLGAEGEKTATRTVDAGEADRMGVAEDAKTADSAADYYRVLLADRLGSLMECQRLYAYWETETEWRTVYRTSPEHRMITESGCYDVSGRLTEERLTVDAGWVARKNPDLIIRVVPPSVLGSGVDSPAAAREVWERMIRREGWQEIRGVQSGRVLLISSETEEAPHLRLAAELAIARTAYPELMADVDPAEALKAMSEEATGSIPEALFFYSGE